MFALDEDVDVGLIRILMIMMTIAIITMRIGDCVETALLLLTLNEIGWTFPILLDHDSTWDCRVWHGLVVALLQSLGSTCAFSMAQHTHRNKDW